MDNIFDIGIEEALLGCIFFDGNNKRTNVKDVNKDWFIIRRNRILFRKLCKLKDDGVGFDFLLAKEKGLSKEDLAMLTVSTGDIMLDMYPNYLQALKLRHLKRKIHSISGKDIDATDADIQELKKLIEDAERRTLGKEAFSVKKDLKGYMDFFEKRMNGEIKSFNLGIRVLDDMIGKIWGGTVLTVGGRPSTGKTSLMLNFASHLSSHGHQCLYLTSEMAEYQLVDRMIAFRSGIDSFRIQNDKLESKELGDITTAAQEISLLKLWILATSKFNQNTIQKLVAENDIDVIFVDYIQRFQLPEKYDNRSAAFTDIINNLKDLGMKRDALIIIGSQLNRNVDSRPDGKVFLSDLKECGGIEEISDIVFLMEPTTMESHYTQKLNIKIAKHRQGPTGEITFAFDKKLCAFTKF